MFLILDTLRLTGRHSMQSIPIEEFGSRQLMVQQWVQAHRTGNSPSEEAVLQMEAA